MVPWSYKKCKQAQAGRLFNKLGFLLSRKTSRGQHVCVCLCVCGRGVDGTGAQGQEGDGIGWAWSVSKAAATGCRPVVVLEVLVVLRVDGVHLALRAALAEQRAREKGREAVERLLEAVV